MLAARLDARRVSAAPVAIELDSAGCEVLWDSPQGPAPAPWEAEAGGWAWRVLFDPAHPPEPGPRDPCPGLVTVGRRSGRELLVNLEAFGSMAVVGNRSTVDGFVQALVLELGTGTAAPVPPTVLLVDVNVEGVEHLPQVRRVEMPEATDWIRATAQARSSVLAEAGLSTFQGRLGRRPLLGLEGVEVVIARAATGVEELLAAAPAGRGVAVVALGDVPAEVRVELDGTDGARLEPLGVAFEPAGLSRSTAVDVAIAVDEAGADTSMSQEIAELFEVAPIEEHPVDGSAREAAPESEAVSDGDEGNHAGERDGLDSEAAMLDALAATLTGAAVDAGEPGGPPARPELLVRVLGRPSVAERPKLTGKQLRVVVYLAMHRTGVPHSRLRDAVWNGAARSERTVEGAVTNARSLLGDSASGQRLLPPATAATGLRLHDAVGTDVAFIQACADWARQVSSSEAIPVLADALALAEGQPFDDVDYEWVYRGQLATEAEAVVADAAHFLASLALQSGDVATARQAIAAGLLVTTNEALYRDRIVLEVQAGNLDAAAGVYRELLDSLVEYGLEPSDETQEFVRRALPRVHRPFQGERRS